ncbi:MAG TPA: asparagine synthase (glutamine-hydrolyzing) [Candidatus Paceibacterota bacterium]
MCGITGFMGYGNRRELEGMVEKIKHRGPDQQGAFHHEGIGLGHARLSIIDTSDKGAQPMFMEDKSLAIVFNGEIYNFKELKDELRGKASQWQSGTDTEVILRLYEKYGERCFDKLSGMFAIALYDFKKKELFIARDPMGKKPLYWGIFGGTLLFASEAKAFSAHSLFTRALNEEALYKYLSYDFVPTPHSIFKGVYKLEAGTYLAYKNGIVRQETFWKPECKEMDIPFGDAMEKLDTLISNATERRLMSDVPLGIFLSGGLDSSTVAYYAARRSSVPLTTFSIGFDDASFDESRYAEVVARSLGTDHHVYRVTPSDLLAAIPEIFPRLDEPLADASIVPTYVLSRETKREVTVALGGDGGDELFAGYPTFQAEKLWGLLSHFGDTFAHILAYAVGRLPVSHANFSVDFKLKKFMDGVREKNIFYRHQAWLQTFSDEEKKDLLVLREPPEVKTFDDIARYSKSNFSDDRNKNLFLYQRTYMMDGVLAKVDRASMLSGLEVRAPFLDKDVVEFVNTLPYHYKIKGLKTKYILKKLMERYLPHDIVWRKKKGFGIPLGTWLRGPLRSLCEELLSKDRIKKAGIFEYEFVERLKCEHMDGARDNRKKLWNLMVFELWRENFLK